MVTTQVLPSKEGQVCKILNRFDDEDPSEVYIVAEDSSDFDDDDNIYVVSLKELQRNIHRPGLTQQMAVIKSDLAVIADDLESYIKSWNS